MALTFCELLNDQAELQRLLGEPMGTGEEGAKENILALIVEATELLNELNWKPWKKQLKLVNHNRVDEELADLLKFYVNIMLCLGVTEQQLREAWLTVHENVMQRHANGY